MHWLVHIGPQRAEFGQLLWSWQSWELQKKLEVALELVLFCPDFCQHAYFNVTGVRNKSERNWYSSNNVRGVTSKTHVEGKCYPGRESDLTTQSNASYIVGQKAKTCTYSSNSWPKGFSRFYEAPFRSQKQLLPFRSHACKESPSLDLIH